MAMLEESSESKDSILERPAKSFKAPSLKHTIFNPKPTSTHNKYDELEVTENDDKLYFCEVAQVGDCVSSVSDGSNNRWKKNSVANKNPSFWKFKSSLKTKSNEARSKLDEIDRIIDNFVESEPAAESVMSSDTQNVIKGGFLTPGTAEGAQRQNGDVAKPASLKAKDMANFVKDYPTHHLDADLRGRRPQNTIGNPTRRGPGGYAACFPADQEVNPSPGLPAGMVTVRGGAGLDTSLKPRDTVSVPGSYSAVTEAPCRTVQGSCERDENVNLDTQSQEDTTSRTAAIESRTNEPNVK